MSPAKYLITNADPRPAWRGWTHPYCSNLFSSSKRKPVSQVHLHRPSLCKFIRFVFKWFATIQMVLLGSALEVRCEAQQTKLMKDCSLGLNAVISLPFDGHSTQLFSLVLARFLEPSFWDLYKWYLTGLLGFLLIQMVLILILLREHRKRTRVTKTLQQLSGRLLLLQDEERRRIAAELHDGLGQSLSIIKNRTTICLRDTSQQERMRQQLEEISATAGAALDEVRQIAHNLRPFELDRLGLVQAVESMGEKVAESAGVHLVSTVGPIDGLFSPEEETSIYRIIQEGLNNVVKHAHATEAHVDIKKDGKDVVIAIEDNGRNSKNKGGRSNGHGFGLYGIAERVRMLGGTHSFVSKSGVGTTLTVRLHTNGAHNGR